MSYDNRTFPSAKELLNKIYPFFSAIYLIQIQKKTYQEIQADDLLHHQIPEQGDLSNIYQFLFSSNKDGETKDISSPYRSFTDGGLFTKTSFSGNVDLLKSRYNFHIFRLSETESVLLLIEDKNSWETDQFERRKMDTLHENYLFSMIVNLKDDTCCNSITTELSVERQDYLDIKYSQWRYMIANMFLPDDKSMFLMMSDPAYIIKRLQKEKLFKFELQMKNMQDEYIWVRLMFNRMKGFSPESPIFVYTVQDIHEDMTRLLQQENIIAAVEEKNQQLADINRSKTVFISNMSHEIRTPINAVLGMDEMILREATDENILSYASDIKSAGTMLLSIINDILDYCKIEVGKMEIIPVEYSTKTLLRDIHNLISIKVKEKQLCFKMNIAETIPATLLGDEIRIKQVIINLLTNAVKYTDEGTVTFEVEPVSTCGDNIDLLIRISDTGIGMKPDDLKNLFTEFQRLDEQRNRNIEGTGLGMSIVIHLLEQMNSELKVESEYGKGSTFSFVLPQKIMDSTQIGIWNVSKRTQRSEDKTSPIIQAPDARILVVDDNRTNILVVKGLLKRTGIQVDSATSGKECLEMLAKKEYHLLLLDHLMPEMDGIETLGHIRSMDKKYEALPCIALTANVMSGARERYMNAGFTDFLEKPIIASKLDEMLLAYLPKELLTIS